MKNIVEKRNEIAERINNELEKEITRVGEMETIAIRIVMSSEEVAIFVEMDDFDTPNYYWEIDKCIEDMAENEDIELSITYSEEEIEEDEELW